jgi:DNA-binding NarL/FixJ family response regulator
MKTLKPQNRNILIIDDHPMSVDSYKTLLSSIESNKKANYLLGYSCEDAFNILHQTKHDNETIHFAFVDVNLPPFEEKKLFSGSDVAKLIRDYFPDCKIIIISMHNEPLWVSQIYNSINPEGFIAKSDIDYKSFPEAFQSVENDGIYYSKSIKDSRKAMIQTNINWDEIDSKILHLIAEGVKTKDLPNYIPLCLSAIEKRKASIKKQLILESGSNKELLDSAKSLGLF